MGSCCSDPGGRLEADLNEKMQRVGEVFPGTHFAIVITPRGQTLAYVSVTSGQQEQHVDTISSLKRTALELGRSFNQLRVPVIHVRGVHNLFSCYDVGENLLAFNSTMSPMQLDAIDMTAADEAMAPLIADIAASIAELQALWAKKGRGPPQKRARGRV